MKYKMIVKRKWDNKYNNQQYSNNLEYFEKYKNKSNYNISIYEKINNKKRLITKLQFFIFNKKLENFKNIC